ncbi:MAG: glycosyltransferase family 4 protein, partial [Deltaproteobacteria bacterium]|nr:glycosyltransferase family 4 protein [Deltaproteobacteria bacterium]
FEYFIQSIPEVIKHYPNSKVLIVGEGPLEDRLKAQGSRLKVQNNLIFTGFRDDIKEVLSSIDILVIPSLLEGFPMITLEGMAMAKPIIATSISGIKEQIIDEESGVLVPPGDHETLTKALIALLIDKKKSRYLGLNARRRVKKYFGVEKMVAETERVYQSLFVSRT